MGDLERACNILWDIVEKNPKSILIIQKLASIYISIGKFEEAKALYNKILLQGNVTVSIYHEFSMLCMARLMPSLPKVAIPARLVPRWEW